MDSDCVSLRAAILLVGRRSPTVHTRVWMGSVVSTKFVDRDKANSMCRVRTNLLCLVSSYQVVPLHY
ncbi:hypothetical protein PAXRUDRAFT_831723 [Paxillus rubicundulus Ve08.2h10]|uniref:Uncharacterized protein n=1 Tax=Paxillus rubicundulus Ve08.2h10 TaxID=930991 RepID=A0A0D0DRM2_9AGAM|nr:hypothetical protein PAXRUDRAFT_831723 [Paxillus rubicundulus Ve08.2h10]